MEELRSCVVHLPFLYHWTLITDRLFFLLSGDDVDGRTAWLHCRGRCRLETSGFSPVESHIPTYWLDDEAKPCITLLTRYETLVTSWIQRCTLTTTKHQTIVTYTLFPSKIALWSVVSLLAKAVECIVSLFFDPFVHEDKYSNFAISLAFGIVEKKCWDDLQFGFHLFVVFVVVVMLNKSSLDPSSFSTFFIPFSQPIHD